MIGTIFGITLGLVALLMGTHEGVFGSSPRNALDTFLGLDSNTGDAAWKTQMQNNNEQSEIDRNFQREMADLQYQRSTPANQMKLLREAGLNPSLMYGQMSDLQTSVPAGAEASYGSAPTSQLGSLLGLGQDAAMMPAQIDLMKAQAANLRSQIPANEKKPEVMQASIDALASQTKLNLEKVNSEQSVQALNRLLGKKTAEETRRICTEIGQMVESFPLKIQELNASIQELKSRNEVNSENARLIKKQADTYMQDIQQKWKNMNAQIELMKAQGLDAYSSALLKSYQSDYYKALKEYQDIMNGVKGDTAKAEAVTGIISRMLGAASGVISAIGSLRSGTPSLNHSPSLNQWDGSTPDYGF